MTASPRPQRNSLGDISVLYVAVMARAVAAMQHDPAPWLGQFGLDDSFLATPQARISIPRYMRLGQAAIELTGNRALGLMIAELTRPVDAGLAGLAAQCAASAGEALATLIRYSPLTSRNSRGIPVISDNRLQADFYSIRPYNQYNFFVVDSVLSAWTQLLRIFTGQQQVLERVLIEYPAQGLETRFEEWFQCPVTFGADRNGLLLAPRVADLPSLQAQPAMFIELCAQCDRELKKIRRGWTTGDRIKDMLPPLLQGETPELATVAAKLGLAPWTLQRQLAAENTGFRELLDEARRDLAIAYIRETGSSLSEIAWLLGFSGPAAFHKAYRRWFGLSPGEHRRVLSINFPGA